jgi:hypothetical protein
MPSINIDAVPPRLQTAVTRDGDGLRVVRTLARADVDRITAVARGDQQQPAALTRHRAISVLADSVQPQVAIPLLAGIVREPAASRTTRVAAIAALGQMATPESQSVLSAMLADSEPRIRLATLKSLGQVANRSALPALNDLATSGDRAVAQQLQLTKALIAHREGLAGPFLEEAPRNPRAPGDAESTRPVRFDVRSADETAADLTRFQGPDYGLRFSERAYRLHCGRADWSLFVNGDLGSLTATERLLERPWIAGILARWMPPDVANATQYLLLTRPAGASVHIDVVRTDGEIVYTGSASPAARDLSFDIADIERPQTAPTHVTGVLSEDGFRLDIARVAQTRVSPRRTEPIRLDR